MSRPRALPSRIPTAVLAPGTALYRVFRLDLDPLWFGPPPRGGPRHRFDDPAGEFRVCYFGLSREAAFAESFLRRPPVRLLSRAFLDTRGLATFRVVTPLTVVPLHGPALARLGVTAAIASGPYGPAQEVARALWKHPSAPDGLVYRCRHDDGELALALYDRAAGAVHEGDRAGVRQDRVWFGGVLDRYQVALDD